MLKNKKIGFIGAGNMASAIASGLNRMSFKNLSFSDINNDRLKYIIEQYNPIVTTDDNSKIINENDIIILAVKPQNIKNVLFNIKIDDNVVNKKLIISIAAGISIENIESVIYSKIGSNSYKNYPIIRVMPNTPALVLAGMTALSYNKYVTKDDIEIVHAIFKSMGDIIEVEEKQMDAITAISGSGPAYVFYFVEALIEAAKELLFSEEESTLLAYKTFEGAVKLLNNQKQSPKELRKQVTSPGGTTEAAIKTMDNEKIKKNFIMAVKNAEKRAKELNKLLF